MATYIWQNPQWPNFFWNAETISEPLSDVRLMQGLLIGRITALGFDTEMNTALNVMTDDLIKSSEIEGVMLDGKMVRSSIAWQLGLEQEGLPTQNRYLEGLVEVMISVRPTRLYAT